MAVYLQEHVGLACAHPHERLIPRLTVLIMYGLFENGYLQRGCMSRTCSADAQLVLHCIISSAGILSHQSEQVGVCVPGSAQFNVGGGGNGLGAARRRPDHKQGPEESSDDGSETSEEGAATEAEPGDGLAARVWDDLVDMEKFWTHAALAVLEQAAAAVVLAAVASCLGAPALRCARALCLSFA